MSRKRVFSFPIFLRTSVEKVESTATGQHEEEEPEALSDGDDVTAEPAAAGIGEPFAEGEVQQQSA